MEAASQLESIRQALVRAVADRHHPWRTPVVASVGVQGPNARTLVLRGVQWQPLVLRFYTDVRSAKVAELQADPRLHWVFWNPRSQLQVRISSRVSLLTEGEEVDAAWARVPESARRDYASITGGGVDLDTARQHFTLGVATAERIEFLQLDRAGHSRGAWRCDHGLVLTDSFEILPP